MVSCDTWRASFLGFFHFNQRAICWGDHSKASFAATACRNQACSANLHGFGRSADCQARLSAFAARYGRSPPLRAISRLIVEGERPSATAIERSDRPATKPREISSRSARAPVFSNRLKCCLDQLRSHLNSDSREISGRGRWPVAAIWYLVSGLRRLAAANEQVRALAIVLQQIARLAAQDEAKLRQRGKP